MTKGKRKRKKQQPETMQPDTVQVPETGSERDQRSETSLSTWLSSERVRLVKFRSLAWGWVRLVKLRPLAWGFLGFLAGTVAGPVIQERFFSFLPGPKVYAVLRAEHVKTSGRPDCNYYMFKFTNFGPVEYMYAKIQFPNPITSVNVGDFQETLITDGQRHGGLSWEKGYDAQGKCAILQATLTPNPDIQSTPNGHIIEIHSSSKLPLGTPLVGLIATTGIRGQNGTVTRFKTVDRGRVRILRVRSKHQEEAAD